MAPSITPPMTATLTSFTASIFRTSTSIGSHAARLFDPADHRWEVRPAFTPQSAYIHPRVLGDKVRYFE